MPFLRALVGTVEVDEITLVGLTNGPNKVTAGLSSLTIAPCSDLQQYVYRSVMIMIMIINCTRLIEQISEEHG